MKNFIYDIHYALYVGYVAMRDHQPQVGATAIIGGIASFNLGAVYNFVATGFFNFTKGDEYIGLCFSFAGLVVCSITAHIVLGDKDIAKSKERWKGYSETRRIVAHWITVTVIVSALLLFLMSLYSYPDSN